MQVDSINPASGHAANNGIIAQTCLKEEEISARASVQCVDAGPAVKRVIAGPAGKRVIAGVHPKWRCLRNCP